MALRDGWARCDGCGAERVGLSFFSIVDGNRIIVVPVEAMDEGLNGGFVDVTDIEGSLSGLVSNNNAVWVDKSGGIDNDLAFLTNWIGSTTTATERALTDSNNYMK